MLNRRDLVLGIPGVSLSAAVAEPTMAAAASSAIEPPRRAKTGMKHRSYRGTVVYLNDRKAEIGREFFTVTVQPDGSRTLRAMCEMDDFRLLRDVTLTVDGNWHPVDAFVRITSNEQLVGSSWFKFTATTAECQGFTALEGRVSQNFSVPEGVQSLGTHPLHGDSWTLARLRRATAAGQTKMPMVSFATSTLPNGGSGPLLVPAQPGSSEVVLVGPERIHISSGSFDTEHFRIDLPRTNESMNSWAMGQDCVPVQQIHTWPDRPEKHFELANLDGDYQ